MADASELDWAGRYWQDKSEHQKHAEIQGVLMVILI